MNSPLSTTEIVFRILAATLAGALVGMERESHGRAAGLRTTILACVASALAMITSEFLFAQGAASTLSGNWRPDPARLGAGTILRHEKAIRGVTTAASLWFVTVLGLAFGSGLYIVGALGLAVALVTLMVLPELERFIESDWFATLTVTAELNGLDELELKQRMKALGLKVRRIELHYDLAAQKKTLSCEVKLKRRGAFEISCKAVSELRQAPGVLQIKWA